MTLIFSVLPCNVLRQVNIYNTCDVTLGAYPHWASLKNMPDHDGNRTYDLASPLTVLELEYL
jgi:hypothetical protein